MIVEDEVIVGMDLTKKLEHLGYYVEPRVLRYAEDVLEAARSAKPDLILMDIRLKGEMDGTQAARVVRDRLGIPVVFLTAFSDSTTLAKAKPSQPYAFLRKPVQVEDLKVSLEIVLHKAVMEQKLKESEIRFRTVADFTYDWETWIGHDGNYKYMSPSCKDVTGYSRERFIEDPELLFRIAHPDDRVRLKTEFDRHISNDDSESHEALEFRIIRPDGETRWIEHLCRPVYAPDGTYIGRRASNRDVSERKLLAFKLERKVAELEEALKKIKTLSGFLPLCSHCKKIRDDEGYWNSIEAYIQNHSDALISHSLCPACSDEIYGHEDWYREMKNQETDNDDPSGSAN